MRYFPIGITLFLSLSFELSAQQIALAPPLFSCDHVYFTDTAIVRIEFDMEGAQIMYELETARGFTSGKYVAPLRMTEDAIVRAYCVHSEYVTSEKTSVQLIKVHNKPFKSRIHPAASAQYPGKGVASLTDLQEGSANLHDGRWLGFAGDSVLVFEAAFKKNICPKRVIVTSLNDLGAWVLPASKVEVYRQDARKKWHIVGSSTTATRIESKGRFLHQISINGAASRRYKIVIHPNGPLPVGHPGAGKPAWLFLDEIIFQ